MTLYTSSPTNIKSSSHLTKDVWEHVNKELVGKAISEFAHELILSPNLLKTENDKKLYQISADNPMITYTFNAKLYGLDHWDIDKTSIKKFSDGTSETVNAIHFITEFRNTLGISDEMLPTYLEEISSTLSGAAFKFTYQEFTSAELVKLGFQAIEHAMTEGHPCFVANNGRIGFDAKEYQKYAPEANNTFKIIWLAGHKSKTTFTAVENLEYNSLLRKELGVSTISKFNAKILEKGLPMEDYIFIPVHPWQWKNKILHIFASDIANGDLIYLGKGDDDYSPQQSIRTLYNKSNPNKLYTKTALSILNMGFMRGLSPYYMQSTPCITEWITSLLEKDKYLKKVKFTMLGEIATVGYRNTNYEVLGRTNAYNKMLSALWRESPHSKTNSNHQLMTMAAFLHVDNDGTSLLSELIQASPYDTADWLKKYFRAYLSPLLHCLYNYQLVFMPHGENLIMVMKDSTPIKVLMKDITEEVIVFNKQPDMPEPVQRLYTETSDKMKVLSIFTDVFDCFFRFMAVLLEKHVQFDEEKFWKLVANCVYEYQEEHPQLSSEFEKYDLFIEEFDRCCLNRLQLKNTKQMLDLADPIESLQLVGTLQNPLAKYKKQRTKVLDFSEA